MGVFQTPALTHNTCVIWGVRCNLPGQLSLLQQNNFYYHPKADKEFQVATSIHCGLPFPLAGPKLWGHIYASYLGSSSYI